MGTLLGLSIAAAAPAAWIYFRGRSGAAGDVKPSGSKGSAARKGVLPQRSQYKAVSVHATEGCCKDALALHDRRLLLEEAPRLPLETCDRIGECQCTYRNHADRRSGDDRRNIVGSLSKAGQIGAEISNVRCGMDRRASVDADLEEIIFEQ